MKRVAIIFLAYAALTIALTYPLVAKLGSVLPNDPGDPALNTWILWWNAHAVPYTARWWNAPAFYPAPGSLAFSEHLLGLSLIASPIQWLGGSPQTAYNVVFLLTFPLCAIGAYLLARELTGRDDAAFIAGLLFGFAPYRIAHLPQIQVLAAFAMPFSLLGLHRYLRDPRLRWLALFGAGWLLQALCNGYYMLFFGVVVALWILWFARDWRTLPAIAIAWAAASLPLAPLLWHYRSVHEAFGFTREFGAIRDFGADVAAVLNTTSTLRVWGWVHLYRRAEGELFPGLTIVLLILAAVVAGNGTRAEGRGQRAKGTLPLVRRVLVVVAVVTAAMAMSAAVAGAWRFRLFGFQIFSVSNPVKPLTYALLLGMGLAMTAPGVRRAFATRAPLGFYGLAAFVTWLFSLGPAPSLMGKPLMYRGPYSLLMLLPGFNALRVPARFWMMTTLCLAIIGAILFDRLASRFGSRRMLAAGVVSFGVLADGWVGDFPLAVPPAPWRVENCGMAAGPKGPALRRDGALMELPLGDSFKDVAAMYRAMSHGRPLVNGYSGYFPPHYAALRFGLLLHDDDVLTQLAALGAGDVVVDTANDQDGSWRRFVTSHAGVQEVCSEDGRTLYRLAKATPSNPAPDSAPLRPGSIRANVNDGEVKYMLDGDRTARWQSGPQSDRTELNIDLGDTRSVSAVQLMLGPFGEDFPRALSIEALGDGAVWQEVFRGGTAGRAFVGAFQSPQDVPLTFEFAPIQTRYLRLRLLANDETYYWSVAELKIFGS